MAGPTSSKGKSWDETHFKLVAVNTTVSYYLWDDTTTSSHICPNSIICPHHGNNTMYLNGQGRPHTWPVFSNRLRDLYFPTCRTGSWVGLFWFLLLLVLLFNIWLIVKWQVHAPVTTTGRKIQITQIIAEKWSPVPGTKEPQSKTWKISYF